MSEKELLQAISEMMDEKLCPIKSGMQEVKEEVQNLEVRVGKLEARMENLEVRVGKLEARMENLEGGVKNLERRTSSIELTLENVTNHNIEIVAEGHSLLNRKLDKALEIGNEREMMLIRINRLEDDVRIIKEKQGLTALV